jgi:hypothetical protein
MMTGTTSPKRMSAAGTCGFRLRRNLGEGVQLFGLPGKATRRRPRSAVCAATTDLMSATDLGDLAVRNRRTIVAGTLSASDAGQLPDLQQGVDIRICLRRCPIAARSYSAVEGDREPVDSRRLPRCRSRFTVAG